MLVLRQSVALIAHTHIGALSVLTHAKGLAQTPVHLALVYIFTPVSTENEALLTLTAVGAQDVDAAASLAVSSPFTFINVLTVTSLLGGLVTRVTLALEGALGVHTVAVGTQPVVLTLIDVTAALAVGLGQETLIAKAPIRPWEVLTATVQTHSSSLAFIHIIADSSLSLVSWLTGQTFIRPRGILTLLIRAPVGVQALVYVLTSRLATGLSGVALQAITVIGARQVLTLMWSTYVMLGAFIYIYTSGLPVRHDQLKARQTAASVRAHRVNATPSVTGFSVTLIHIHTAFPLCMEVETRVATAFVVIGSSNAFALSADISALCTHVQI